MITWITATVFWAMLIHRVLQRGNTLLWSVLPTFFLTAMIALGFDLGANVIAGWYEYKIVAVNNEWAILVLGLLGYPVIGCLFVSGLPDKASPGFFHIVWWVAILLIIEVPALITGELVYTVWQLWWSPFLYVAVYAMLAWEYRWRTENCRHTK